jgi:hypothetical protein
MYGKEPNDYLITGRLDIYQSFSGISCLPLQGRRVSLARKSVSNIEKVGQELRLRIAS